MILRKHWFKILAFAVFIALIIRIEYSNESKRLLDVELQLREDYINRIQQTIDSTNAYLLKTEEKLVILKDHQEKNDSILKFHGINFLKSHNQYLKLKNDVSKIKNYSVVPDSVLLKRIQPENRTN